MACEFGCVFRKSLNPLTLVRFLSLRFFSRSPWLLSTLNFMSITVLGCKKVKIF